MAGRIAKTSCFRVFLDNRDNRFTFVFGEAITIAHGGISGWHHIGALAEPESGAPAGCSQPGSSRSRRKASDIVSRGPTPRSESVTSEIFSGLGRDCRRPRAERRSDCAAKKTRASVNTSGLRFHRTACRSRRLRNCEVIPRNERRALELFCLTRPLTGTMVRPSRLMSRRHPLSSTGAAGSNSFLRTDQPGGSCDDAGIMCRQFHKA